MAIPNWGLLVKSQVDNETIEEAISRLILAHESDEESHLGAGESLQSHKASEIIDHLASSIVEDKLATGAVSSRAITSDQIIGKDIRTDEDVGSGVDGVKMTANGIEMWQDSVRKVNIPKTGNAQFKGDVVVDSLELSKWYLQTYFEALGQLLQINTGSRGSIELADMFCTLEVGDDTNDFVGVAYSNPNSGGDIEEEDPAFEAWVYIGSQTSDVYICNNRFISGSDFAPGALFKFNGSDQHLYCEVKNDAGSYSYDCGAFSTTKLHKFRIEITSTETRFYVDGVLVHTDSSHLLSGYFEMSAGVFVKNIGTDGGYARVAFMSYLQNHYNYEE